MQLIKSKGDPAMSDVGQSEKCCEILLKNCHVSSGSNQGGQGGPWPALEVTSSSKFFINHSII